MSSQLDFFKTPPDDPEVEKLVQFLDGRDWLTAEQLCCAFGFEANDASKRKVRSIASATPKILSYPGSPGYKLTRQASPEELEGAITLKRQGETMISRYVAILNEHRFGNNEITHGMKGVKNERA